MMHRSRSDSNGHGVVHFQPRRKRLPKESMVLTLNLAPMVDVVFLLLTFFIATTTFKRAEGILPSQLPRLVGQANHVELPVTPIVIHFVGTGPEPEDFAIRLERFAKSPATIHEVFDFLVDLQSQPGFDAETPIIIRSGDDVRWDHVVGCWNAAVRAGCRRITFGVQ